MGRYSSREWVELVASYGGLCGYCGLAAPLTADHRVPLIRGGPHTIDNIIPACRPCNCRKGRLTEREFRVRLENERWTSTDFEVVDWWAAREIEWVS